MATNLGIQRAPRISDVVDFCASHSLHIGDLFAVLPAPDGFCILYNNAKIDISAPTIASGGIANGQGSAEAVPIYAALSDWSGIVSFKLYFKGPAMGAFVSLDMEEIAPGVYQKFIPAYAVGVALVEWYLEAIDQSGNIGNFGTSLAPKNFTVV